MQESAANAGCRNRCGQRPKTTSRAFHECSLRRSREGRIGRQQSSRPPTPFGVAEKVGYRDAKRFGKTCDVVEGNSALAALDGADEGTVEAGSRSEGFLGKSL